MRSAILFILSGLFEIGGGYLVWLWLRDHRSLWMGILGFVLLSLYGVFPIFQPVEHSFGRVYAAYGAVFIVLSVLWGWKIDSVVPDFRDWLGMGICICGAIVMMWPRRV